MNRIPGGSPIGPVAGAYGAQTKVKKAGSGKPSVDKADKVEFSIRVQEAIRLREQLGAAPEVRADKVEALRQAIENGTYKPDVRAVADKLLRQKVVE